MEKQLLVSSNYRRPFPFENWKAQFCGLKGLALSGTGLYFGATANSPDSVCHIAKIAALSLGAVGASLGILNTSVCGCLLRADEKTYKKKDKFTYEHYRFQKRLNFTIGALAVITGIVSVILGVGDKCKAADPSY